MKKLLSLEEAGMFFLGVFLFYWQLDFTGWIFWILLLTPDISMVGYLINSKAGAYLYNLIHHKLTGIVIYISGCYFSDPTLQLTGLILFSHSSMDRVFGYGLKYTEGFHSTHLGMIGKQK